MAKETLNYDSLFAGEVRSVITIDLAASQTVKRGDLLECTVAASTGATAASFSKPSAAAKATNIYAIAAEDVTTSASQTAKITVYRDGFFNQNAIVFGGESTAAENKHALMLNNIYVVDVQ